MPEKSFLAICGLSSITPPACCDTILGEVSLGILAAIKSARRAVIVAVETRTTCNLPKLSESQLEHNVSPLSPIFIQLVYRIRTDRTGASDDSVKTKGTLSRTI